MRPRSKRLRRREATYRSAFRAFLGLSAAICLAVLAILVPISRSTLPDLFDLVPKIPASDGYAILAWQDLARAPHTLNGGPASSGAKVRALGYMMQGGQMVRDGDRAGSFFLLPDAGSALQPAHRFGDAMIDVRLDTGYEVRFQERSLVWVWGTLRTLPGDPSGDRPLYVLDRARAEPADKTEIAKYFR